MRRIRFDATGTVVEDMLLGDRIERVFKPIARVLKLPCLDAAGNLKKESGCAKRRDWLNKRNL